MKRFLLLVLTLISATPLFSTSTFGKGKDHAAVEEAITKLEHEWLAAYVKADSATLERIAADDFLLVDPSGNISTKEDDIRAFKSGNAKWQEAKLEEIKVRVYGKTAIATGVITIKGTDQGQDISGKFRFTDVFVRTKETWRAVSSQATAIAAKK